MRTYAGTLICVALHAHARCSLPLFVASFSVLAALHLSLLRQSQTRDLDAVAGGSGSSSASGALDLHSLDGWRSLRQQLSSSRARTAGEWSDLLRATLHSARDTLDVSLPALRALLDTWWTQPAASRITHLRNQRGLNVDDYQNDMRSLLIHLQQLETRYNRRLQHKLEQAHPL